MKKELKNHWDDADGFIKEGVEKCLEIDLQAEKGKALQKLYRTKDYKSKCLLEWVILIYAILVCILVVLGCINSFDSGYNYAEYLYNTTGMIP